MTRWPFDIINSFFCAAATAVVVEATAELGDDINQLFLCRLMLLDDSPN